MHANEMPPPSFNQRETDDTAGFDKATCAILRGVPRYTDHGIVKPACNAAGTEQAKHAASILAIRQTLARLCDIFEGGHDRIFHHEGLEAYSCHTRGEWRKTFKLKLDDLSMTLASVGQCKELEVDCTKPEAAIVRDLHTACDAVATLLDEHAGQNKGNKFCVCLRSMLFWHNTAVEEPYGCFMPLAARHGGRDSRKALIYTLKPINEDTVRHTLALRAATMLMCDDCHTLSMRKILKNQTLCSGCVDI